MKVVGLMSGTSIDAIDVAVCEFRPCLEARAGWTMELLGYVEQPFPASLRQRLLDLLRRQVAPLDELTELNFLLGVAFADAALDALTSLDLPRENIDLIASHGQTIYHLVAPARQRSTLQMGEPAMIAARTGVTVVADFRVADMAAGGEGAPLVFHFDSLFFGDTMMTRAVQNIGGMANVTFLPAGAGPEAAYAFDTGPGNALIDYGARHFSGGAETCDRDGAMAARGKVHQGLLERVLEHPYFSRPPPKTTGRELFGDDYAATLVTQAKELGLTPEDTMATLTAITAESIARAYRDFGPPIDLCVRSEGDGRAIRPYTHESSTGRGDLRSPPASFRRILPTCLPRSGGCNEGDGRAQVAPTTAESRATSIPGDTPILGSHAVINRLAEVILSGGGARNPTLVSQLEQRLPGVIFRQHGEFGVPADAKEAVAFALLGYEALHGRPANLPRCTGASRSAILGKITPGDNYGQLMRQVFGDQRQRQEGCNP